MKKIKAKPETNKQQNKPQPQSKLKEVGHQDRFNQLLDDAVLGVKKK
jgi:hypothetical protein